MMQLYYLYEKSPKKCSQLEEVCQELRMCLEESDRPQSRGTRPIRASGTRFISHKVSAMARIIDKYGVYCNHLTSMSEDTSFTLSDRAKLSGYAKLWTESKVLIGCAYFFDVLKPCSELCKVLQRDEVCIVRAVEVLMKVKKDLDRKKTVVFEDLPTVKKVIERVKSEDHDGHTYQGSEVKHYDVSLFLVHTIQNT